MSVANFQPPCPERHGHCTAPSPVLGAGDYQLAGLGWSRDPCHIQHSPAGSSSSASFLNQIQLPTFQLFQICLALRSEYEGAGIAVRHTGEEKRLIFPSH